MVAIMGPRGIGKTTLLLQHIKLNHKVADTLYVKADDIFFATTGLYELAEHFQRYGGKHLFIDEIHKYPTWSRELKMIYDYLPEMKVIFTGSSILDIYKGFADLSRRVVKYDMTGLSFREFIRFETGKELPVSTLEEVLEGKIQLPEGLLILPLFRQYLQQGYYPFYKEPDFLSKLENVTNLLLEVDIPTFANMNSHTIFKLKKLLRVVADAAPFKPNLTKIARIVTGKETQRGMIGDYLEYMEKAGLLKKLFDGTSGISQMGKIEKLFINNTNLMYLFSGDSPDIGNIRETFFLNQTSTLHQVTHPKAGDFKIDGHTFEIGGKKKTFAQVKDIENAYVVKDDIEYGHGRTIPLWHFGLLY